MDWLEVAALTGLILQDGALCDAAREVVQGLCELPDSCERTSTASKIVLANARARLEDFRENLRQVNCTDPDQCNRPTRTDVSLLPALLAARKRSSDGCRFEPSEHSTADSTAGSSCSKGSCHGSSGKFTTSPSHKDNSPFGENDYNTNFSCVSSEVKESSQETSPVVKVYADGVFDLMHSGHFNAIRQAAQLGSELHIGVVSDEEVLLAKGVHPIFTCEERVEIVEACKWVTRVIPNAPYDVSLDFFRTTGCDVVAHGDDVALNANGQDSYSEVRSAGLLKIFKRTSGVSSTSLVARLLAVTLPAFVTPRAKCIRNHDGLVDAPSGMATTQRLLAGKGLEQRGAGQLPVTWDEGSRTNHCWSMGTPKSSTEEVSHASSEIQQSWDQFRQRKEFSGYGTEYSGSDDNMGNGSPIGFSQSFGNDRVQGSTEAEKGDDSLESRNRRGRLQCAEVSHPENAIEHDEIANAAGSVEEASGEWYMRPHFERNNFALPNSGISYQANVSSKRLLKFLEPCRNRGENDTVVYCDGSFDILHNGHVRLFKHAKERVGGFLIVGVYDDETVRALKGPGYPVQTLRERILCVLAMKYVDEVIIGAPIEINDLLIQSYGIHRIVRGKTVDVREDETGSRKLHYGNTLKPHLQEMVTYFDSQSALTTSIIINRIIGNREKLRQALRNRTLREEMYYLETALQSDAVREALD